MLCALVTTGHVESCARAAGVAGPGRRISLLHLSVHWPFLPCGPELRGGPACKLSVVKVGCAIGGVKKGGGGGVLRLEALSNSMSV